MQNQAPRMRRLTLLVMGLASLTLPATHNRAIAAAIDAASVKSGDALRLAASKGDLVGIETALRDGADVNDVGQRGHTALIEATIAGSREAVRLLLERRANPNLQSTEGFTALRVAARDGRGDLAMALLDGGADPNILHSNGKEGAGRVLWKQSVAVSEHRGVLVRPFLSAERMIAMLFGTYLPRYPNPGDETRDYSVQGSDPAR